MDKIQIQIFKTIFVSNITSAMDTGNIDERLTSDC